MSSIKKNSDIRQSPIKKSHVETCLRFSFQYLDLAHSKFRITSKDSQYFEHVFQRLKDVSSWRLTEFRNAHSKAIRSHQIKWETTTEEQGFTHLNSQFRDYEAWQFQFSANEHGRVHGFITSDTFYVVWLDPDHKLYS